MRSGLKRFVLLMVITTIISVLFFLNQTNKSQSRELPSIKYSPEYLSNLTALYYPRLYSPFNYIHNHPNLCIKNDGDATTRRPLTVLILVTSSPENFQARAAIRRTWGTIAHRSDVTVAFMLGATPNDELQDRIDVESVLYDDTLQEDFLDTFRNLTLKSVMMLRWVSESCQQMPQFVLKIHDDCFLNPHNLLAFAATRSGELAKDNATVASIYGDVFAGSTPRQQDPENRWYVSDDEYPDGTFPSFTSGPSYLMDGRAVPLLYKAALSIPLVSLEDVFVTGLCAVKAGVTNVDVSDFSRGPRPTPCDARHHISFHEVPTNEMHVLWYLTNDRRLDSACSSDILKNSDVDTVFKRIIEDDEFP